MSNESATGYYDEDGYYVYTGISPFSEEDDVVEEDNDSQD